MFCNAFPQIFWIIMAKKRTSKQRNQVNIAKNVGKNSPRAKNKNNTFEKDEKQDGAVSNLEPDHKILGNCDPISTSPKGLSNLGNTCFFNSVMQNLCRTSGLLHVLTEAAKLTDITLKDENISPLTCQLPMMAKLSESLLHFLVTMGNSTAVSGGSSKNRSRVESPRLLFSQICSVSPRFRTYQQQDSQELLQCLMDGIKYEEIKRRKQAILAKLGLLGKKASAVDEEMKEKVKTYGRIACQIPTVVDIIFCGEIVSSVLCDECGRITQVHEEFLDIPLPIAETHSLHHPHNVSSKKSKNKAEKEQIESDSSSDLDNEIQGTSFKANSSSKHAKKKQKEQERRSKHKRKRTKSAQQNEEVAHAKEDVLEQQPASQITSHNDDNPPICDKTNASATVQSYNEQSADTNEQELLERNTSNSGKLNNHDLPNTDNPKGSCNTPENETGQVLAELSKTHEHNITKLCNSIEDLSLRKSTLSGETENNESHETIDILAEEIVSNIILTVCGETGDISEGCGIDSNPSEGMSSGYSNRNTDKTHLLGGKPIPLNDIGTTIQLTVDKQADCMASKNQSEDEISNQRSERGSSPSSGNDEKSDSENPAPITTSLFETPVKRQEIKFTGFCKKLPSSLSSRYEPDKTECSVLTCLHKFTMAEMLTGNNKFGCEECTKRQNKGAEKPKTVYCNASKQMLIETPPLILTLQLKRFQQYGSNLRKLSKRVVIPPSLDLSPFCSNQARKYANDGGEIWYNLYGIVEHSGSMSRGHYTAYVHVRPETRYFTSHRSSDTVSSEDLSGEKQPLGQWYHISDTSVSKCTLEKALSCNAYLIFYEREPQR